MAKKKAKKILPQLTLVGEFKGREIYIAGDINNAKEYSERMEIGFEAIDFIESLNTKGKQKIN